MLVIRFAHNSHLAALISRPCTARVIRFAHDSLSLLTVLTRVRTRGIKINENLGMSLSSRPVMVSSVTNRSVAMHKSHGLLGNELDTGVGHGLLAQILLLESDHVVLENLLLGGLSGSPGGVSVGRLLGVLLGNLNGVAVVADDGLGDLGGHGKGPLGNESAEHGAVVCVFSVGGAELQRCDI